MTRKITNPDRQHEVAWGIRVPKDPATMNAEELEDTIYSIADYASRVLLENRALLKIVKDAINNGKQD